MLLLTMRRSLGLLALLATIISACAETSTIRELERAEAAALAALRSTRAQLNAARAAQKDGPAPPPGPSVLNTTLPGGAYKASCKGCVRYGDTVRARLCRCRLL